MLNTIIIMGRLTRDPEVRYSTSGTAVTSFNVAVERDYTPKGQEKQTDFIDCVAFSHTAEFIGKYFQKGSLAVVDGRLESNRWQDKDGNNRISFNIKVDNIYFGGEKKKEENQTFQPPSEPTQRKETAHYQQLVNQNASFSDYGDFGDGEDGELPF